MAFQRGTPIANCMGMRHDPRQRDKAPAAMVENGTFPGPGRRTHMMIDGVRRVFICLVLGAATLLAALEVTVERGGASATKADLHLTSPLRDMDRAIARDDVASALTA